MFSSKIFNTPFKNLKIIKKNNYLIQKTGFLHLNNSGIYTYLPLALNIIHKLSNIIRLNMNKISQEIQMPILQHSDLWKISKRWNKYGKELFKLKDRKYTEFCLSPTHEELVSSLIKNIVSHNNNYPLVIYQIQTKFRDEIRPRFGIVRAREFLMKDAYSFSINKKNLNQIYYTIKNIYKNIFSQLNLNFTIVEANTGSIGGTNSHEFLALSNKGNYYLRCETCNKLFKANKLLSSSYKKHTNNIFFDFKNNNLFIYDSIYIQYLNKQSSSAYSFLGKHKIKPESLINLLLKKTNKIYIFLSKNTLDKYTIFFSNIISNFNKNKIDLIIKSYFFTKSKLTCFKCSSNLILKRNIEIAHIFKLEDTYSKIFNLSIFQNKVNSFIQMGCYGIGISRLVHSIVEQSYDKYGYILPKNISLFDITIITNKQTLPISKLIYDQLLILGLNPIIDNENIASHYKILKGVSIGESFFLNIQLNNLKKGKVTLIIRKKLGISTYKIYFKDIAFFF